MRFRSLSSTDAASTGNSAKTRRAKVNKRENIGNRPHAKPKSNNELRSREVNSFFAIQGAEIPRPLLRQHLGRKRLRFLIRHIGTLFRGKRAERRCRSGARRVHVQRLAFQLLLYFFHFVGVLPKFAKNNISRVSDNFLRYRPQDSTNRFRKSPLNHGRASDATGGTSGKRLP